MIAFGREICGQLEQGLRREWLVTNGLGGYASGTVAGANTRSYHGLLVAAWPPPRRRALLLAKLEAEARLRDTSYSLDTNEWAEGQIAPEGYRLIERFALEGTIPTWTYALAEARLLKRVFMVPGENTTFVTYQHERGSEPIELRLTALCTARDHHGGAPPQEWHVTPVDNGIQCLASTLLAPLYLFCPGGTIEPLGIWYHGFRYRSEAERGLPQTEDLYACAVIRFVLPPGELRAVVASTSTAVNLDPHAATAAVRRRERALVEQARLTDAPDWVRQLVLAADQFLVKCRPDGPVETIMAGYPWFADWSRDTMISLPGLCLATRRCEEARSILCHYAQQLDGGLLPNQFPEADEPAAYNSVDAPLWLIEAVRQWLHVTGDWSLVRELYPAVQEVVDHFRRGTRHGIGMDSDGLLRAGEPGLQVTWMDAKVGDWVVTPRLGKPVEVNGLWARALDSLAWFAAGLQSGEAEAWAQFAHQVRTSFGNRFWFAGGYLYDVVDGPNGDDASLRPNQLIPCSFWPPLLPAERLRSVVERCSRELAVSLGLRTLAPSDERYRGAYIGDQRARDAAYHQGTVWPWLIGPYVLSHLNAYHDPVAARQLLAPFAYHLTDAGLGTVSELADGDPPHTPRGCIAQAWSVASLLQAWQACSQPPSSRGFGFAPMLTGSSIQNLRSGEHRS